MSNPRKHRLMQCAKLALKLPCLLVLSVLASCSLVDGGRDGSSADNQLSFPPKSGFKTAFDPTEIRSGGDTTVYNRSVEAYSKPASNLTISRKGLFFVGNDFFSDPWVQAPSSTTARDGLGPLFNVAACQSCHIKDGRGHAPMSFDDDADSLLIRLARPPRSLLEETKLEQATTEKLTPVAYGGQLQDRGVLGVPAEGQIRVNWRPEVVTFSDGATITLRRPEYTIVDLAYGELPEDTVLSPRVAPPMIGLGLLEAISEADIIAQEDPEDRDGDGISGRTNRVVDVASGKLSLGRFGWKAGQPTLMAQNSGAFNGDIGITSALRPDEQCTVHQQACNSAASGVGPGEQGEVSDLILDAVEFYVQFLAVPARRDANDETVLAGKALFFDAGCAGCHTPSYVTETQPEALRELSEQTIFPYTDMLLHDMGDDLADRNINGELVADFNVEFLASNREWRTPPLWGIGLAQVVSQEATFLHDGRARTPMEAVLWHGGEAASSREAVIKMSATERHALEQFLNSL